MSKIVAKEFAFANQKNEIIPMVFVGPEELVSTKYGGLRMGFKKANLCVEWKVFTPAVSKLVAAAAKKSAALKKVKELK